MEDPLPPFFLFFSSSSGLPSVAHLSRGIHSSGMVPRRGTYWRVVDKDKRRLATNFASGARVMPTKGRALRTRMASKARSGPGDKAESASRWSTESSWCSITRCFHPRIPSTHRR